MPIINITIDTDRGGTLAEALAALGLPHVVSNLPDNRDLASKEFPYANGEEKVTIPVVGTERVLPLQPIDPTGKWPAPTLTAMDGDRKRGEPGAGHRRRTNKEIAEDQLYFDSLKVPGHVAVAAMEEGVERTVKPMRFFYHPESDSLEKAEEHPGSDGLLEEIDQAKYEEIEARQKKQKAAISSGGERVDPADAQDAADEAAESAANRGAEPMLDDLRRAIGLYQKKFGMEQAARRTKEMLGMPLFEVPSKDIGLMVHRVMAAYEKDGAKFTPVETKTEPTPPVTATKDEVNAVFTAYAEKYDGKGLEADKWLNTQADIPRVFERLFGKGKASFKTVEKTPENLGRILEAVRAELEKNTFGRTPK